MSDFCRSFLWVSSRVADTGILVGSVSRCLTLKNLLLFNFFQHLLKRLLYSKNNSNITDFSREKKNLIANIGRKRRLYEHFKCGSGRLSDPDPMNPWSRQTRKPGLEISTGKVAVFSPAELLYFGLACNKFYLETKNNERKKIKGNITVRKKKLCSKKKINIVSIGMNWAS